MRMCLNNNFAIVKFIAEDDATGIVALNWLHESRSLCYFPNVVSDEAKNRLLKKKVSPEKNWHTCPVAIMQEYETYSAARLHLRKAEETSHLESDEEETQIRKRKKRIITLPEDLDEEEPTPTAPKRKKTDFIGDVPYPIPPLAKLNPVDSSQCDSVQNNTEELSSQPFSSTAANVQDHDHESKLKENTETNHPSTCFCMNKKTEIQLAHIVSAIGDLYDSQIEMHKKLNSILGLLGQQNTSESNSLKCDEEFSQLSRSLPFDNEEKLIQFNENLKVSKDSRKQLIKFLLSIGGRDARMLLFNMLRRLLVDEVAELYSLTGKTFKNSLKKSFMKTEFYQIIFCAIQKAFPETTEEMLKHIVSDWLNQAKVRRSRRDQRNQPNKNSEEI